MMVRRSSATLPAALLRLTALLSCAFAANITVDDNDPSIVYSPPGSWQSSSNLCSTCLVDPDVSSYHEGIHSFVTATTSSTTPTPPSPSSPTQTSSSPNVSSSSFSPSTTQDTNSPNSDSDSGKGNRNRHNRALARRIIHPRLTSDDTVDIPVNVSYNFTGTAIYIFCIQPLGEPAVNGTPTNMNLSFILDNKSSGSFSSTGTTGTTGFQPNKSVLSLDGLSDQPHQLVVNVGDDSVFLFDYLIYTSTHKNVKRDVATFAGAIGGTVGVLSLVSLGIAISIIRRRTLAARRDRLDNEANGAGGTPLMSGPVPFVPRYFSDTIIPSDPPTYNDALSSSNHNNTPVLASLSSSSEYVSRQRSYADIPPASPPPPLEEIPPPPPFPVAVSLPIPDLPPGVTPESISVENPNSTSPDNGSSDSNFTSPHEAQVLLPPSTDSDVRPPSRTSTLGSIESPENSENSGNT